MHTIPTTTSLHPTSLPDESNREQEKAERLAKWAEDSREPTAKLKKAQAKFGGKIPKKAPKARRNYIPPDSDED